MSLTSMKIMAWDVILAGLEGAKNLKILKMLDTGTAEIVNNEGAKLTVEISHEKTGTIAKFTRGYVTDTKRFEKHSLLTTPKTVGANTLYEIQSWLDSGSFSF